MKITIEFSRKKILAIFTVLSVACSLLAYAAIKYTTPVMNTVTVNDDAIALHSSNIAYYSISAINWGGISKGATKSTDDVFSCNRGQTLVNNAGVALYAGWCLNGTLPVNATLTAFYYSDISSLWETWAQNSYSRFPAIAPGASSPAVKWVLTIGEYVPTGVYNFEIDLLGADTQQG